MRSDPPWTRIPTLTESETAESVQTSRIIMQALKVVRAMGDGFLPVGPVNPAHVPGHVLPQEDATHILHQRGLPQTHLHPAPRAEVHASCGSPKATRRGVLGGAAIAAASLGKTRPVTCNSNIVERDPLRCSMALVKRRFSWQSWSGVGNWCCGSAGGHVAFRPDPLASLSTRLSQCVQV